MTSLLPLRLLLGLACLGAASAQAHEGHHHDDGDETPAVASPPPVHAAADTPQLELVAERRGADVVLYLDDYATNAPLDGLQVSLRSGAQLLQAAAAGEGSYRVPADLVGTGEQALEIEVHGKGLDARLQTTLPATSIAAPAAAGSPTIGIKAWIGAAAAVLLLGGAWLASRRRRKPQPRVA